MMLDSSMLPAFQDEDGNARDIHQPPTINYQLSTINYQARVLTRRKYQALRFLAI
jgi:hypothetical protein